MDEAGAKVHLSQVKMPKFIKQSEEKAEKIKIKKLAAVSDQDYEKAAAYRDSELKMRNEVESLTNKWQAELRINRKKVTYDHIAETISDETGIPIYRMTDDESQIIEIGIPVASEIVSAI